MSRRPLWIPALVAGLALVVVASMLRTGRNIAKPRLGCIDDTLHIVEKLAVAQEKPWCDFATEPREAHRIIWSLGHRVAVASVRVENDSAIAHGFGTEMTDVDNYFYRYRDTTIVRPASWYDFVILGRTRRNQPRVTRSAFNGAVWPSEVVEARPAKGDSAMWVFESMWDGEYHASVFWGFPREGRAPERFQRVMFEVMEASVWDRRMFARYAP